MNPRQLALCLLLPLGACSWLAPTTPEPAPAPAPEPEPYPVSEGMEPQAHFVFERPADAAGTAKPRHPDRAPTTTIDGLGDEGEAFVQSGLEGLDAVNERCAPWIDGPRQIVARGTIDGQGLAQMELIAVDEDEDHDVHPSQDVIPAAFAACFRDASWERTWYALREGDRVSFELVLPVLPPR